MTPQQLKAMKMALEALKKCRYRSLADEIVDPAITAINEVLAEHAMRNVQRLGQEIEPKIGCVNHDCDQCKAQPEQEPVAWMTINEYGEEDDIHYENPEGHLLEGWTYKPLYTHPPTVQLEKTPFEYWNAVEGWVKIDEVREHFDSVGCGTIYKTSGEGREPLYTAPLQRKPLTKEEMFEAIRPLYSSDKAARLTVNHSEDEYRAIEAAHGIKGDA